MSLGSLFKAHSIHHVLSTQSAPGKQNHETDSWSVGEEKLLQLTEATLSFYS